MYGNAKVSAFHVVWTLASAIPINAGLIHRKQGQLCFLHLMKPGQQWSLW